MRTLEYAIALRQSGQLKEAIDIMKDLLVKEPENAQINYQLAWAYDVSSLEKEAVPYYEKAIEIGLEENDQVEAIIGLGSTYRTIGRYQDSKDLLMKYKDSFDNKAIEVFLAMAEYNLSENEAAVGRLLKIIAETSQDDHIMQFSKAIGFYADRLNQVW